MSSQTTRKSESLIKAQDQESDSKKTKLSLQIKKPDAKLKAHSLELSKGRPISPSRNQSHPLPKQRKKKDPIRITSAKSPAGPVVQKGKAPNRAERRQDVKPNTKTISFHAMQAVRGPVPPMFKKPPNSTVSNQLNKGGSRPPKEQTAERMQGRLKKKSPWFQSIRNPVSNGGVKIPDPIGTDTGTYQHIENIAVAVNEKGCAGLRIVTPYINSVPCPGSLDGWNYQVTREGADEAGITWGSSDPAIIAGAMPFNRVPALMKANARSHRIVSASIVAQSEVSTLNDMGELCSFITPFGCNPNGTAYKDYVMQYDSTIAPVNIHKPLIARWYPLQAEANPTTPESSFPTFENVSYQDFVNPNDDQFAEEDGVIPWEFGIVAVGCGSGVIRFQICVNYEFIPLFTTTMVSTTPSPVDEVEESLVNKWISDEPMTEIVSLKQASAAQSTSTVSEDNEPSGLGMLFNVIEESLPLIVKGAAMLL